MYNLNSNMADELYSMLKLNPAQQQQLLFVFLLVLSAFCWLHSMYRLCRISRLLRHGVCTQGRIIQASSFSRRHTCLYVALNGRAYKLRALFHRKLKRDDSVAVFYNPAKPQEAIAPAAGYGKPRLEAWTELALFSLSTLFILLCLLHS